MNAHKTRRASTSRDVVPTATGFGIAKSWRLPWLTETSTETAHSNIITCGDMMAKHSSRRMRWGCEFTFQPQNYCTIAFSHTVSHITTMRLFANVLAGSARQPLFSAILSQSIDLIIYLSIYLCMYAIMFGCRFSLLQMAAVAGCHGGHVRRIFFVLPKTDFTTNWPTPQVAQMQKKLSASGGLRCPDPLTTGSAPGPRCPDLRYRAPRSPCRRPGCWMYGQLRVYLMYFPAHSPGVTNTSPHNNLSPTVTIYH